jgi:hypothetical protein
MKTGDTVRDRQGRVYQIGPLLGRGLWGKCYAVREDPAPGSDRGPVERVLKLALGPDELGGRDRLAAVCRTILAEQGAFLEANRGRGFVGLERMVEVAPHDPGPRVFAVGEVPVGESHAHVPALVLTKLHTSFDRRIAGGATLDESLRILLLVLQRLADSRPGLPVHGALKHQNVLLDDRGQVVLSDVLTPTLRRNYGELLPLAPAMEAWVAPETRLASGDAPIGTITDTYAVGMMLLRAVHAGEDVRPSPTGLDKGQLAALKEMAQRRLRAESSNPRFHARVAERLAAILNRALSRELTPSPPYRFTSLEEMKKRTEEVHALVQPRVAHVGRLILDRPPGLESFATSEDAVMSVTVGCSTGVEDHSEIGSGIAVFDAMTGVRKKHVPCSYTVERHPSGRFRFKYRLTDLAPGAYKVRIAFAIHESGHEPSVVEALFGIHAAAGYVPPKEEPEPRAISLDARRNDSPTAVTEAAARVEAVAVVEDDAPEPVEPPQHGEAPEVEEHPVAYVKVAAGAMSPQIASMGGVARVGAAPHPRAAAVIPIRDPSSALRADVRIDDRPTRPSVPAGVAAARALGPGHPPMMRPRRADEDTWDSSDWEAILGPDGGQPWTDGPLGLDRGAQDLFLADKTDVSRSLREPKGRTISELERIRDSMVEAARVFGTRATDLVGGDAYRTFIAGALLLIIVLLFTLIALR